MINMKDLIKKQGDMIRKESGMNIKEASNTLEKTPVPAQVKRYMSKFIDAVNDVPKLNRRKKISILYKVIRALGVSPNELVQYISKIRKDLKK